MAVLTRDDVVAVLGPADDHLVAEILGTGATLRELTVLRCEFPGLLGNEVDVRRDLNLSGSTVTGALPTTASQSRTAAIWLCESQLGGRLLCVGTVIDPGDGRAIQADRIKGRRHRPAHPRLHHSRRGFGCSAPGSTGRSTSPAPTSAM